jgi:hypothetical protein
MTIIPIPNIEANTEEKIMRAREITGINDFICLDLKLPYKYKKSLN